MFARCLCLCVQFARDALFGRDSQLGEEKYISLNQLGSNDQSIVMQDQLDGIVQ